MNEIPCMVYYTMKFDNLTGQLEDAYRRPKTYRRNFYPSFYWEKQMTKLNESIHLLKSKLLNITAIIIAIQIQSCKMSRIYPCKKDCPVGVKSLGGPKKQNHTDTPLPRKCPLGQKIHPFWDFGPRAVTRLSLSEDSGYNRAPWHSSG